MKRLGVLLAVVLVFTACGDDDDDPVASDPTADLERFCELSAQLEGAGIDDEPIEEFFARADVQAAMDEIVDVAPDEVRDDVERVIGAAREVAESGSLESLLADAEVTEAGDRLSAFEDEQCASDAVSAGTVDGWCSVKAELDAADAADDARLDDLLDTTPEDIAEETAAYVEARRAGDFYASEEIDAYFDSHCAG